MSAIGGSSASRSPVVRSGRCDHLSIERSGEDALKNCQDEDRRSKQANDRKRGRPRRQRKCASEDQKFADEAIQSRQTQRRKQGDAHQAAEHRGDFAQAAEIVQSAQAAAAFFQQGHKPKQRRGRQAVIEHLQNHAVERGRFCGCE